MFPDDGAQLFGLIASSSYHRKCDTQFDIYQHARDCRSVRNAVSQQFMPQVQGRTDTLTTKSYSLSFFVL